MHGTENVTFVMSVVC